MKDWITISTTADVEDILERSMQIPQIIFKDSITCGISAHAKERLKDGYALLQGKADFYYLDLLAFRPVSSFIAQRLGVTHQSPQIIILKNKEVVYTSSHHAISPADIAKHL